MTNQRKTGGTRMTSIRTSRRRRRTALGALGVAAAMLISACNASTSTGGASGNSGSSGGSSGSGQAASSGNKPTITLVTNSWEGSLANNVVAQYVIEHDLHYPVKLLDLSEIPAWPATAKGQVSAVLEEWGHAQQYNTYVKGSHQVIDAGQEGPLGNIGWYVPTYLMKAHPELATWKGVQKDWKMFVTPQSAPQGQFLDGSPSYVTNDAALVKNLHINMKVIYAGSEAAQLTEIETAYKQKKPLIFYWYTPQYQNAIYKFSQVQLPPWTTTCAKLAASKINCAYPPYDLYKIENAKLPSTAPAVAAFIKRFHWTSDDQDQVAFDLAVKKMSNAAAGKAFVDSHASLVQSWLHGPDTKIVVPPPGT
ncbi:glycine/betaine ABC transporter substrate-binding protein [Acidimicrobiaceae bacterium USS-CC1]|uniref:Glycine/betaine ABC transporter substrate-binding protein n=1 Tax=Acidiferrimicrobium australe TaxID=2664430 RepID=A0ABW9QSH4_9ACTN|nr:glycine/betaine ABC transporter substrate-binding protein [Acidiferrimicrobium australe]